MRSRCGQAGVIALAFILRQTSGFAQDVPPIDHAQHQHPGSGATAEQPATPSLTLPEARAASGTAWLPDESPMYAVHHTAGAWELMLHGSAFVQLLTEGGYFGGDQFGSINWAMGMGRRTVGSGVVTVKGMFSLEPWTIRGCGYPDMLATGELCQGEPIHERQHPHDLFMEAAVEYSHPLNASVGVLVYGGPVGEPALGPVAFPHRLSAMGNPIAPIAHHWLDATHLSFGVLTGAVYGRRWKVEASAFNGREPDEDRHDIDLAPLDSLSGRVWFLPSPRWALQVSGGHLEDAEPPQEGRGPVDKDLFTASATYHRTLSAEHGLWASTIAWGRSREAGAVATAFLLAETSIAPDERNSWFARGEVGSKTAHELSIHGLAQPLPMGKLQAGYVRYFAARRGWNPGLGGTLSASIVTDTLAARYGGRVTYGGGFFFALRPAPMASMASHAGHHME